MDQIVSSSVHSLLMDMTASLCVTAMLHTVIMSTVVYSPQEVRSLIVSLYFVSAVTDLKDSDRCFDTQFYYQSLRSNRVQKKVMFIVILYKYIFKTLSNDKNKF